MLKELYIKNYALINELTLSFSRNLTVLSGETGAGKSIIIGALGLILGEKAKTSYIRSGMKSCIVEGRLEVHKDHPVLDMLKERGIEHENGTDIVVRRIITTSGVSKSFINGLQVTVKDLREITGLLFDIHGQHEHQSLLDLRNHLFLLDQYGKHQSKLEVYRESYRKIEKLNKEIEKYTIDEREKERRIDILKYSINEIDRADLKEGEDIELEEEYKVLSNYEKLVSTVKSAYDYLDLHDASVLSLLESALSELYRIKDFSSEISTLVYELDNSKNVINDITSSLKNYVDSIEYEPGKIDRIQTRIELIKGLKKKYGDTIKDIKKYRKRCQRELDTLEGNEDIIDGLKSQLKEELSRAEKYAKELSIQRRVSAKTLKESVMKELSYLSMDKARFKVNIVYKESDDGPVTIDGKRYELSQNGLDLVEFLLSANIGEPFLPLKNVASGGELSRIMLAIKTVLGDVDPILTFVFDEIDTDIGGKVAWAVGNRLKELSRLKQILCITHQAQIASKGDLNVRVEKVQKDERTVTEVKWLDGPQKVAEIARMISGEKISETALKQAHEMIRE